MNSQKSPGDGTNSSDNAASGSLLIREAGSADAMKIAALHSASWQTAYRGLASDSYLDGPLAAEHRGRWQSLLGENPERPSGFIRLAERDGQLAGFITLWVNYKKGYDAYVDNLHVHPGQRGGGIGERLIRDAADCAAAQGCRNLSLEVLEGNEGAIRFYERLGAAGKETAQELLGDRLLDYRLMVWDDITKLTNPKT